MASLAKRLQQAVGYIIRDIKPDTWFSPLQPLTPMEPQTRGRQFDYQSGANLNYRPRATERVPFIKLKALAENSNLLRMVMNNQKNLIESFDWQILPRTVNGKRPEIGVNAAAIKEVTALFMEPEPGYDWGQWLRRFLEQVYVYDALTIWPRSTLGGDPYSLEVIDGATITPLLNADGRRPTAPSPAYEQVLKGVVTAMWSLDELIYFPQNPRVDRIYGQSRVEMIIQTVETEISRMQSQYAYFSAGNMTDGVFTGPKDWTTDQIKQWQGYWDDLFSGNLEARRHGWWVPAETEWHEVKQPPLKDEFDEWIARKICFAFSTSPSPFIKQQNRSNQEGQQEVAEEGGIATDMQFIKRVMDKILRMLGYKNLEFTWSEDREFDPHVAATIDDLQVKDGFKTINEVRDRLELEPIEGGDTPMLYTPSGWMRLEDALKPPPDPLALAAAKAPTIAPGGNPAAGGGSNLPATTGGAKPSTIAPTKGKGAAAASKAAKPKSNGPAPPKASGGKSKGKLQKVDGGSEEQSPEEIAEEHSANALDMDRPAMNRAAKSVAPKIGLILQRTGVSVAHQAMRKMLMLQKDADTDATVESVIESLDLSALNAISDAIEPALSTTASDGGEETLAKIGPDDKSGLINQVSMDAVNFARERSAELVGKKWVGNELIDNPNPEYAVTDATRDMIRNTIGRVMASGGGHAEVKEALLKDYAFSDKRADLITHTEIRNANSQGGLIGARRLAERGITMQKLWLGGLAPCIRCVANIAAGPIALDENFPSGDSAPPGHPGCFCTLSWRFPTFS